MARTSPRQSSGSSSPDDEFIDDGVVAEINITPLTDIFLVLLIIFMVTSSAIVDAGGQTGLSVDLPTGGAGTEEIGTDNDLAVAILEDGSLVFMGEETTMEGLAFQFEAATKKSARPPALILQADRGVPHGRVVEVMELARKKGLTELAIATASEEK